MPAPHFRLLRFGRAALFLLVIVAVVWGVFRRHNGQEPRVLQSPSAAIAKTVMPVLDLPAPSALAQSAAAEPLAPETLAWIESRFPKSRVIERRDFAPDSKGQFRRELLLETGFKYPLVEIDEHIERDPRSGAELVRVREAMVADHFILKPRPGVDVATIAAAVARAGGSMDGALLVESGLQVVHLARGNLGAMKAAVAAFSLPNGPALYAEPDALCFTESVPNDPAYSQQTGLNNTAHPGDDINAARGWDLRNSAAQVVVAVIDTGVRYTHQDLRSNMWHNPGETAGNKLDDDQDGWVDDVYGVNFYGNNGDPNDDEGHGTHVAGILGASGNDGVGIAGVAWQVKIMAIKFQNSSGVGATSDAVRAVNYAVAKGANVMNNSWGDYSFQQSLRDAIAAARDAGILFIASAGNEGFNTDTTAHYPSGYDLENVIAVGNLDVNGAAYSSNVGAQSVDVFAPGTDIYSLSNTSDTAYQTLSGTSMSAPFVSGIVALLRAQNPAQPMAWVKQRILETSVPLQSLANLALTSGRVDLYNALANVVRPPALIATPPVATSGDTGNAVTLSVEAGGDGGPFRFQWFHDSMPLAGQTGATLTLTNLSALDGGAYTVTVSNFTSSVSSAPVNVTITTSAPRPTLSPVDASALAGQEVILNAAFAGSRPMTFQWERNGTPIDGATDATLTLPSVTAAQEGDYRLRATSAVGTGASALAHLSLVTHYLEKWSVASPVPTDANYKSVAYLNGGFVAVGEAGTVSLSADGERWQLAPAVTGADLVSVSYGAGRYVAVGTGGAILTSTDAITWTVATSGTTENLQQVAFGGGQFIAVGGSAVLSSADGLAWTPRIIDANFPMKSVVFGGGRFVAVGSDANYNLGIFSSGDGVSWTKSDFSSRSGLAWLTYDAGTFWFCNDSSMFTSPDGLSWTWNRIFQNTGSFIHLGDSFYSLGAYSAFSILKTLVDSPPGFYTEVYSQRNFAIWTGLSAGAGRIVAVGTSGAILVSKDGTNFSLVTHLSTDFLTFNGHGNGEFYVRDYAGKIFSSTDGLNWQKATTPTLAADVQLGEVAYGNGVYVTTDSNAHVWTSMDGAQWTNQGVPVANPFGGAPTITFVGGYFWLSKATISGGYRSSDGINWAPTAFVPESFGGGRWLHVQGYADADISTDGLTWQNAHFAPVYSGPSCYANGQFYVLSSEGEMATSSDGVAWKRVALNGLHGPPNAFIFQDGVFVAATESGVFLSLDGISWAKESSRRLGRLSAGAGVVLGMGNSYNYTSAILRSAQTTPLVVSSPTVVSAKVHSLSAHSATLGGTVMAGGASTTVAFEYGTSPQLGQTLVSDRTANGRSAQAFEAFLTGLQPATQYYFRVTAANTEGTTSGDTLSFTTPQAMMPVALDDGPYALAGSGAVLLTVLANDSHPGGDAFHISTVTQGLHGTVTISGGALLYTPAPDYSGDDQFTYSIADSFGGTATASVSLSIPTQVVPEPSVNLVMSAGEGAPGAGMTGGPLAGTKVTGFGPPAIDALNDLAATVTLLSGNKTFPGIVLIKAGGTKSLPVFAGLPAPGLGAFESFSNPVLSAQGALAFIGKAKGASGRSVQAIWSNALSGNGTLALVLKAGDKITDEGLPNGVALASVSSIELHDGALYVLGQLTLKRAAVLLRVDSLGIHVVAREQGVLSNGVVIQKLSVFQPAPGSAGQGRWSADQGLIARATLSDHSTALLRIGSGGNLSRLISTWQAAGGSDLSALGLPAISPDGSNAAFIASIKGNASPVMAYLATGAGYQPVAQMGVAASGAAPALFKSFFDPLVNADGLAFMATLRGVGVSAKNSAGIWWGAPGSLQKLARLGEAAPDGDGQLANPVQGGPVWQGFTSVALPAGANRGPIVFGKVQGATVNAGNAMGIWSMDSGGVFRQLLRTGPGTIAGNPVTIATLSTLGADAGAFGSARAYNPTGSIAVKVTLADRTQALLRLDVP